MKPTLIPVGLLLTLITLAPYAGGQQADTALIVGTVADTTGAVIPGVSVTFTHVETGTDSLTQTNETGSYRSNPLRIGTYLVTVESDGFKTYSGSGVSLSIGDVRELNVALEVGAVTEVIEVEASAPLLQTSETSAGTVIENRQIVDLPLNGRDYLQLAVISAGTVQSRSQGISIGGQRGTEINFMIDGVDNNNQSIASQGNQKETVKPSIDALAEFKVITNGFSAEYGKSSSGIVSLAIKSGTNELHGTGFYFMRDEALDARYVFNTVDQDKRTFARKQYGFAVGGPIKKNRSFIFGDMEFTDIRESATFNNTIPWNAIRNGLFDGVAEIYDPGTGPNSNRSQFPNNRIPQSRFDRIADQARNFYPDTDQTGNRNFIHTVPRNQDNYKWDIRWDHNLSDADNLFARWSSQQQLRGNLPRLPATQYGTLTEGGNSTDVTSNNVALGWNRIWSPTLVSNFRLGWNYIDTDVEIHPDVEGNVNSMIDPGRGLGLSTTLRGMTRLAVAGFTALGNSNWAPNLIQSQTRQVSSDNTWTKGNHAIKFGTQMYFMQSFIDNPQTSLGRLDFARLATRDSPGGAGGHSYADFLLGILSGINTSDTVYMNMRAPYMHFYVQDDWKVNDRLTFNLGLRYEYNPPMYETRNGIGVFDRGGGRGSQGSILIAGASSTTVGFLTPEGRAYEEVRNEPVSRLITEPDKNNFGPRLGVAYKVNEKTVIRVAYGIFYGTFANTGGGEYKETQSPFHFKVGLSTPTNAPFRYPLHMGLPPNTITAKNARAVEMSVWDLDPEWPMAQNWNFNIQYSLPGDALLEVGYFGNKMNYMMGRWDENVPRPGESVWDPVTQQLVGPDGGINERRPWRTVFVPAATRGDVSFAGSLPGEYITVGRSNTHSNRWNSLYHGFQTKLEKRYSKGLTYIVSYSWSHAIGDWRAIPGSGGAPGENARFVKDVLDLSHERGPTPQDIRHRLIGSIVYELPFGQGKRYGSSWSRGLDAVLGGWSLGTIATLTTGTPATPAVQGRGPSNVNDRNNVDRPNVVSGAPLTVDNPTPDRWWNPAAFTVPDQFTFGDAGKGILRLPGRNQWDFSAYKSFRFTEKYAAQVRIEAFNFTNTPQWGNPAAAWNSAQADGGNFGRIGSAANPRNLQFGIKFIF